MFQKCPICCGTGIDQVSAYTGRYATCPTCKGKRIIDTNTRKPPENDKKKGFPVYYLK